MSISKIRYFVLFVLLLSLCSWGEKVHRKINSASVEFLPKKMSIMKTWAPVLADHSVDPDKRRKTDKNEFVRHFIDLDNYSEFVETGKIDENFELLCNKYGREFVIKNGTLPWVCDSTYKALVTNFKTKNFEQAALTAADLGHYIADGFMPLHTSANYDGQLSNQKGIHARFEDTMINQHIDKLEIEITKLEKINDVQTFIFRNIYENFELVDDLLIADSIAYDLAGKKYSKVYYEKMWSDSEVFTTKLINSAAKKIASLYYKAWLEAGKPELTELQLEKALN